jgi:hypothetical protein
MPEEAAPVPSTNSWFRLAIVLMLMPAGNALAADTPAAACTDLADRARTLLKDARIDHRAEPADPREPNRLNACRVTIAGGLATNGDPRERLEHYLRERGWTRASREHPAFTCQAQPTRDPAGIEIRCVPPVAARPTLPVTRLGPAVRGDKQADDPGLIRLPDGRVLPRPAAPQAPMTDQPLDWKSKP